MTEHWINEDDMVIGLVSGKRVMVRVGLLHGESVTGTQYGVKTGERVMRSFAPVHRRISLKDITIVKPGRVTLDMAYAEKYSRERRDALADAKVAQVLTPEPVAAAIEAAIPLDAEPATRWVPAVGDRVTLKGVPEFGAGTASRVDDDSPVWARRPMAYVTFPGHRGQWQYIHNLEPVDPFSQPPSRRSRSLSCGLPACGCSGAPHA